MISEAIAEVPRAQRDELQQASKQTSTRVKPGAGRNV